MHIRGCRQGAHPDLFPCIVLHVDGPFPISRVQVEDSRIDIRGAVLVLTYGMVAGGEQKKRVFSNFGRIIRRLGTERVCSSAKCTRTDHVRRFLTLSENADWA